MFAERKVQFNDYVVAGLGASVVLHLLFAVLVARAPVEFKAVPMVVDVDIVTLQELSRLKQRNQIVSTPNISSPSKIAPDTNQLSDVNTVVEKEQIKRGLPDAGIPGTPGPAPVDPGAAQQTPPTQSKPQGLKEDTYTQPRKETGSDAPSPESRAPVEGMQVKNRADQREVKKQPLKHLTLDQKTLLKDFAAPDRQASDQRLATRATARALPPGSYEAFSRPLGSGARFLGKSGSADHLPHLPDGDITLLNAKADQFAVFVRRVAIQVFSQIRQAGWESLRYPDVQQIKGFSTVRAVLSADGKLMTVRLEGPSGSSRFDTILIGAARAGSADPHPPPGAVAADGNIHFIFKAKTWSRITPGGRNSAGGERRWLMLATGLE